jgi:hypothetical protein
MTRWPIRLCSNPAATLLRQCECASAAVRLLRVKRVMLCRDGALADPTGNPAPSPTLRSSMTKFRGLPRMYVTRTARMMDGDATITRSATINNRQYVVYCTANSKAGYRMYMYMR